MPVWRTANLLQSKAGGKRLWQLIVDNGQFNVIKESVLLANEAPPPRAVAKDWQELFRRKLNIAWLPIEKVFLRVIQLPTSDPAEILSMIELQLEKLSPLPVTHVVWSMRLLPKPADKPDALQTVIVIIALRSFVEEHLGELEKIGFLADRLECPALDELLASKINEDGVWIFPGGDGEPALIAWQQDGILQNLTLLPVPAGPERAHQLKAQIEQIAWAAELEGWLKEPPSVHLVTTSADAAYWEPILREWSERPVDVRPPIVPAKLAALAAERSGADETSSLLPKEFSTRYRQQFIDGLWMRGVVVAVGIYLAGVLMYFGALYSLRLGLQKEQRNLAAVNQSYIDSQKDKQEIDILKKRADLQYAALDAWKAVAEAMPEGITLNDMYFRSGKLELHGTAPADDLDAIYAFNDSLRHATKNGTDQPLFVDVGTPKTITRLNQTEWNFTSTTREMEAQ
jgi:hypothetical protein